MGKARTTEILFIVRTSYLYTSKVPVSTFYSSHMAILDLCEYSVITNLQRTESQHDKPSSELHTWNYNTGNHSERVFVFTGLDTITITNTSVCRSK